MLTLLDSLDVVFFENVISHLSNVLVVVVKIELIHLGLYVKTNLPRSCLGMGLIESKHMLDNFFKSHDLE